MRSRAYVHEELINRDKASLDIFWLRDESLEDSDNLPDPDFSPKKSSSFDSLSLAQDDPEPGPRGGP